MRRPTASLWRRVTRLAPAAAAAALLALPMAVRADYYSASGSLSGFPNNPFPTLDPAVALFNAGGNVLQVGVGAGVAGSFSMLAGAHLIAAGLFYGDVLGNGSGTIGGTGALAELTGTGNRLNVGNWGTGTLTVSGGALVDATANADACLAPGASCASVIGHGAGSTGSLTVTGAGTEVRALRPLAIANADVYTQANGGFNFGTPGADTHASVSVLAGATLRSDGAYVSNGPTGPAATGAERTFADVVIDGAGSQWIVSPDRVATAGTAAFIASAHANATSTVTIRNGGTLTFDASGGSGTYNNFVLGTNGGKADLTIESGGKLVATGGSGGTGTFVIGGWTGSGTQAHVTITGAGSELNHTSGFDGGMLVGGPGSTARLDVLDGGKLTAMGGLYIGATGGSAVVNVDNARIDVGTSDQRLVVGFGGTVTMTIANGAVVDAALPEANCKPGDGCGTAVAGVAGGTTHLMITGTGSELRTLRNFKLAEAYVDLNGTGPEPQTPLVLGTPGGTSTGIVEILAGGSLRTQFTTLGSGPGGPDALGTEKTIASVLIDGKGSQWIVTPSTVGSGNFAFMGVATHANATADVTVSNGGLLSIDGRVGSAGPSDGINLGSFGTATLTVTGTGSQVETLGVNPFINVGGQGGTASSASASGTFEILAGATASTLYLNVGRKGGTGTMTIDGAPGGNASTLSQIGVGVVNYNPNGTLANDGSAARASIGRDGGNGTVTVSNGGRWTLSDGGQPSLVSGPQILIGRGANSTGALTITGPGSRVELTSNTVSPGGPSGDNLNPLVAVGFDNPATTLGTLVVSAGGKLVMNGNAVSTTTIGRATTLNIGGRSGTAATGIATVTGAGSEILMTGFDTLINVGREDGSTGTLNVFDGAQVSTISMAVGIGTTGATLGPSKAQGTVNIDNATIALSGSRTDSSHVGAGTTIGRGTNGVGALNLTNGASLTITPSVLAGGMSIGGDQFLAGGTGTVSLDGGSSITFGGAVHGNLLTIGRSGIGTMMLAGASLVDVGALTETRVGSDPGGIGTLTVSGGSTFRTGIMTVGGFDESVTGGTGSASFGGAGTVLEAYGATGLIGVGVGGAGALSVTNQATLKGTVLAAGLGATGTGTITLNNATANLTGQANDPDIAVAGAGIYVGGLGGAGTVNIAGGTKVTITNNGSLGSNLSVGGFAAPDAGGPGIGTLVVSGGSQLKLVAAPGLAVARIGHEGTGTATFTGSSSLDVGDGQVYVAALPGSTGTLTLTSGSVINAGFVGVGVGAPGTGKTLGTPGGTGTLVLNDSTINASDRFELGPGSTLTGNNGVINVASKVDPVTGVIAGPVVIAGTIAPGNSPGRMRINCDLIMLPGSSIVLEIGLDPSGHIVVDNLILGSEALFDLKDAHIQFSFLEGVNPKAVSTAGGLSLDLYLLTATGNEPPVPLSERFKGDQTWDSVVTASNVTAKSTDYTITNFVYNPDTGGATFVQTPVPEPSTWAMLFVGLCVVVIMGRRRQATLSTRRTVYLAQL